jgi:hypothetical protein
MAIVRVRASSTDPLTEEMIAELQALEGRPIDYSDIPKMTH